MMGCPPGILQWGRGNKDENSQSSKLTNISSSSFCLFVCAFINTHNDVSAQGFHCCDSIFVRALICLRACMCFISLMNVFIGAPFIIHVYAPSACVERDFAFHRTDFDSLTLDSFGHDSMRASSATSHVTSYTITIIFSQKKLFQTRGKLSGLDSKSFMVVGFLIVTQRCKVLTQKLGRITEQDQTPVSPAQV